MKKIITIAIMAAAVAATSSCVFVRVNPNDFSSLKSGVVFGSDNAETKTFTVPQFTGIDSSIPADIDFFMTEGEPTITVTAPDNLFEKMNFEVEDGVLMVRFDGEQRVNVGRAGIKVTASSATLENLAIHGAGDFDAAYLECSGFNVEITGAGDITLGTLKCTGDLSVSVRGAGDIDVEGLECHAVKVDVAGAGDVALSGKAESANLSIRGAGDIDVRMLDCPDITSDVSGMGSIRRK